MKTLALILSVLPSVALAQGVRRDVIEERTLWSAYPSAAMAVSTHTGGTVLQSQPARVIAVTVTLTSNSGGGAGSTVIQITDGTNQCNATIPCASTSSGAPKALSATLAGAAGAGCSYPAGAPLSSAVVTAGCTTTRPTFRSVNVIGVRK